jgi:septal ring factor EnvC (AmiA/AmiB activator)
MNRAPRIAWLVLAACMLAPLAFAQDSLETAKRKELDDVQRRARENREAATRLKGRENQAVTQLKRTERDLNVTRKRLEALQRRQKVLDQQLDMSRADLQRSVQSLGTQKERLARRLRSIYKEGGDRDLEFMLSAQSFGQLLARWDFLVMIAEQDRVMLDDLRGRKEQVEANQQQLQLHLTEIDRNAKKTTKESSRLTTLRAQRAGTVQTIQNQRQAYEAAAAELEKTARAIRGLLATLEKKRQEEANRAKAQGREPQPYAGDFARGQGQLAWPLRGNVIGHFGNEVHPKWGTITPNNGIDIETPIGTPVRVVAKGRVDYVSEDYGTYGQMILVNHGDGYYTMYGHLSSIGVSVGQDVNAGAVIGQSGDSGSLKGPILHFEIRKGGTPLDPQDWLQ